MRIRLLPFLCYLLLFTALPASSEDKTMKGMSFLEQNYLFGNWEGKRDSLEEDGYVFEAVYTGEVMSNRSGGIKQGSVYQGNLDLTLTVDTGAAGFWQNGTFFVYLLDNHGKDFTGNYVGDLQTVSNIETADHFRLYEVWYEHLLMDGELAVLIGQHDLNSEFNVTEYGGLFLNSSFGIEPDISANVPVSIFPVAAPAVRLKWTPNETVYLQAAVYDGNPGDPNVNHTGWDWRTSSQEGAMMIAEAGLSVDGKESGLSGIYKVGVWSHTASFDDVADVDNLGNPIQHNGNQGLYFIADQKIYNESEGQGLGAFFQIGIAPDDRNEVDLYLGGGLHYTGLLPGRDEDMLGFAVAHASISNKKRSAEMRDNAETTYELTYHAIITPWLSIQPDIQWVVNPNADPTLNDAFVIGVRTSISF